MKACSFLLLSCIFNAGLGCLPLPTCKKEEESCVQDGTLADIIQSKVCCDKYECIKDKNICKKICQKYGEKCEQDSTEPTKKCCDMYECRIGIDRCLTKPTCQKEGMNCTQGGMEPTDKCCDKFECRKDENICLTIPTCQIYGEKCKQDSMEPTTKCCDMYECRLGIDRCLTKPTCQNEGMSCTQGSMEPTDKCCDKYECKKDENICLTKPTSRGKKQTPTEGRGCEEMVKMQKAAFVVCESDGAKGLTWAEVAECEVKFADSRVPLPTEDDFTMFDTNSDGTLFMEEWMEKTGC